MNRKIFILVGILLFPLILSAKVDVEAYKWGFNSKISEERINPLSVLINNTSDKPFEGEIKLSRSFGQGAELVRKEYIGPFSKKWVQFYPYTLGSHDDWTLRWGNEKLTVKTPDSQLAPAVVLMESPDSFSRRTRIHVFPSNLFPSSVSATDGLGAVVLDSEPDLAPVQRQSFLDWLKRGGIVYLIPGRDGKYPEFSGPLKPLNIKGGRVELGSGMVLKLNVLRKDITEKLLLKAAFPPPAEKDAKDNDDYYGYGSDYTSTFFRKLRILVKTDHNWVLFYFLIGVYMLLIGPANFLVGRKTRDYKKTVLFFILTVTVFGLTFAYVGRRGYGEEAVVNDLSYARDVGGGSYDVEQWMDVFVTSGDYYTLAHPGKHNYYSACQDNERVNGNITNGIDGFFFVDIPLFSSRSVYHKGKMKTDSVDLDVKEWIMDTQAKRLVIDVKGDSLKDISGAWAVYKGNVYKMTYNSGTLQLENSSGESLSQFYRKWHDHSYYYYNEQDQERSDLYDAMVPPLIVRALGGSPASRSYVVNSLDERDNAVKIFVLAETPSTFHLKKESFGGNKQQGRTLFQFDIFKPGTVENKKIASDTATKSGGTL